MLTKNRIIDNANTNFQAKIDRVYNAVAKHLGISEKLHYTKKYLLKGKFSPDKFPAHIKHETFKETTYFIHTGKKNTRSWIKIRQYDNGRKGYFYYFRKLAEKEEERIELIRNIDLQNYGMYFRQRDKNRAPVNKEITAFIWMNRNCVVETFKDKESGELVSILRVSFDNGDNVVPALPDFLEFEGDVSEEERYFTINL